MNGADASVVPARVLTAIDAGPGLPAGVVARTEVGESTATFVHDAPPTVTSFYWRS